ncbi:thiamine pyrophosphate-dependent enzyme [Nocardioides sp.]|uniref:thiamine pyrophosphate-dependent enzyme n=1 Tax=Nocardioides sp. TaxID=35761 RepID=UPI002ED48BC5
MELVEEVDEHFTRRVTAGVVGPGEPRHAARGEQLLALFGAQAQSRHLDLAARWLAAQGEGFYTIGSAGHESNAALGLLSAPTDPALLHYRSGGFYAARAARSDAEVDPVRDVLRGLTASAGDPISGGRHKVFGHPLLHVVPQTSTIASHLPRSVGLGFALGLARRLGRRTPWPDDAVVLCSFGDASVNHSTAAGALNAAAYVHRVGLACPVLLVCEDNGWGISTRTPNGWPETVLGRLPGVPCHRADGSDPEQLLEVTEAALAYVRETWAPAVLHLRTVRLMGHAGSDVEMAYRSRSAVAADLDRDPLVATALALVRLGLRSPAEVVTDYEAVRARVRAAAEEVRHESRLASRAAVMAPLRTAEPPARVVRRELPDVAAPGSLTLAQAINRTLSDAMSDGPDVLVFGQDVGAKGGVYGVTRGLQKRFGAGRVFDTLLDETTILGTALGTSLAGFLPVPEIQYLAYLHTAEDQLRGEAASLRFFSDGQYQNGMVVRVAGLAYQQGFGGHFHNDNALAVLRDVPGIVVAVPSHPADAPGLLRHCLDLARHEGRVCVFVEPIARYHTRDLLDGDGRWTAPYAPTPITLGEVALHTTTEAPDVVVVTYGNGVYLGLRAAATLREHGLTASVLDLRWLTPLPVRSLLAATAGARRILVVDEGRSAAGVGESVVAALAEAGSAVPLARISAADSYIPLGPAAGTVLVSETDIVAAAHRLVG